MRERRRLARWQINNQVKVKINGDENFTDGLAHDINFKGIRLSSKIKITEERFLNLRFILGQDLVINSEVWVVWRKIIEGRNCYGFYFTKIADTCREKIYGLICKDYPEQICRQWWAGCNQGGEGLMDAKKVEDKRIFERFCVKFPLKFLKMNSDKQAEAQTWDISAKGMGFLANEELAMHTDLELWLRLSEVSEPLYARGKVVWSKPAGPNEYRVGVNLEKADFMGLSRILRSA